MTTSQVQSMLAEQRSVAQGEDSFMVNGPARRILATIDRLVQSWRSGYEEIQKGATHSDWRHGQMTQTEFAIGLLLGVPTKAVHDALMETGGTL